MKAVKEVVTSELYANVHRRTEDSEKQSIAELCFGNRGPANLVFLYRARHRVPIRRTGIDLNVIGQLDAALVLHPELQEAEAIDALPASALVDIGNANVVSYVHRRPVNPYCFSAVRLASIAPERVAKDPICKVR